MEDTPDHFCKNVGIAACNKDRADRRANNGHDVEVLSDDEELISSREVENC
jgi:hypothetical protein